MFAKRFNAVHGRIDDLKDLNLLRGSKYVQSNLRDIYSRIKKDVSNGIQVLFSGTPCQVSGLYKFLSKDYFNLYTCDIVCDGDPSQRVWRDYLSLIKENYSNNISRVNFRE